VSPRIQLLELPEVIWRGEEGLAVIHEADQKCTPIAFGNFISSSLSSHSLPPTLLLSCYIALPNQKVTFLAEFHHLLSITSTNYGKVLLFGDLNIRVDDRNDKRAFGFLHLIHNLAVASMSLALSVTTAILSI